MPLLISICYRIVRIERKWNAVPLIIMVGAFWCAIGSPAHADSVSTVAQFSTDGAGAVDGGNKPSSSVSYNNTQDFPGPGGIGTTTVMAMISASATATAGSVHASALANVSTQLSGWEPSAGGSIGIVGRASSQAVFSGSLSVTDAGFATGALVDLPIIVSLSASTSTNNPENGGFDGFVNASANGHAEFFLASGASVQANLQKNTFTNNTSATFTLRTRIGETLTYGLVADTFAEAVGFGHTGGHGNSSASGTLSFTLGTPTEAPFTWQQAGGAVDGEFVNPAHWDGNAVPGAQSTAIFDLNTVYTVLVANAAVDRVLAKNGTVILSGKITSDKGVVDGSLASPATVTLTGAASSWHVTDSFADPRTLVIGDTGRGIIAIANGALLDTTRARLGQNAGAVGKATVSGVGSVFTAPEMHIGEFGDGTVEVTSGGEVRITDDGVMLIADEARSTGKVTIQGAQSKITASGAGNVAVGNHGHGVLEIRGGATADIPNLGLGGSVVGDLSHPGDGTVVIDGVGTTITSMGWAIGVAPVGLGKLTLSGGAVAEVGVTTGGIVTVAKLNSFGILNVLGTGTHLSTDSLYVGIVSGTLANSGTGLVQIDHSIVNTNFFSVGPSSQINMIDGTLSCSLGQVFLGGKILGTGRVVGNVTVDGYIAPALLPAVPAIDGNLAQTAAGPDLGFGTLTIDGNYHQTTTGTLAIEIAGLDTGTQQDKFIVTGNATLGGKVLLKFRNGFAPTAGQQFDFLEVNGTQTGAFDSSKFTGLKSGFTYSISSPQVGLLSLTALTTGIPISLVPGDFNQDGFATLADLDVMFQALTDQKSYQDFNHLSDDDLLAVGNLDGDDAFSNGDLQAMLYLLIHGSTPASPVPEPTSVVLLGIGAIAGLWFVRASRMSRSQSPYRTISTR